MDGITPKGSETLECKTEVWAMCIDDSEGPGHELPLLLDVNEILDTQRTRSPGNEYIPLAPLLRFRFKKTRVTHSSQRLS